MAGMARATPTNISISKGKLQMSKLYPWKRFWCPRDGTIPLSDGGFLYDPEDTYAQYVQKGVVSFDAIQQFPCLVLLGEPGIGKTTTITAEYKATARSRNTSERALLFNLNEYGSEDRLIREVFNCTEFNLWKSDNSVLHLFLDSLDECRIKIQTVGPLLLSQLKKVSQCLDRLQFRIACRTADWPNILENGLPLLWSQENTSNNSVGIYELVPLRRKDIHMAAEAHQIDANTFVKNVIEKEVVPLAIKPLTLEFLLSTFKTTGALPESKLDLYERGCRHLCEEWNPNRQDLRADRVAGRLSADQRLVLASHIAAVSILCRKPVFLTSPDSSPVAEEISITEMTGNQEKVGSDRIDVTENNIREALGTGLFSGRGSHRMGFAHQTYGEYLAARYLSNHNFDLSQIKSFLFYSDCVEEKIIPQLYETAAWLASLSKDILREIVTYDPQVLLKADAFSLTDEDRSSLTKALLTLLQQGKINTREWELYHQYHKLAHPQLADILRPYIAGQETDDQDTRNLAIDIAEVCKVTELQELLANIALDQSETNRIRDGAARAVWLIGDKSTRKRLLPLAIGRAGDDPDDQLKGHALRALWPDLISASEIFDLLTIPKRESFSGAYHHFLRYELVKHISPDDLPYALSWVDRLIDNGRLPYSIRSVVDDIVISAWKHLHRSEVLMALSRVCINLFSHHRGLIDDRDEMEANDDTFSDTDKRHLMAETVVTTCCFFDKVVHELSWDYPKIIRPNDLPWILQKVMTSTSDKIALRWAVLARQIFNDSIRGHLDMALEACKQSPQIKQQFQMQFEPVELESERAREIKEGFEEQNRWEKERKQNEHPPVLDWLPKDRIQHWLDLFEKGKLDAWDALCADITLEDTSQRREHWNDLDITNLPGWQNSDENTRQRILDCAKKYLVNKPSDPLKWIHKPHECYAADLLPFKAFHLLKKYSPDLLQGLPHKIWRKWMPTFLGVPFYGEDRKEELNYEIIRQAYELWPDEFIFWVELQIDAENCEGRILSVHEKLERCWDNRLRNAVLSKLKKPYIIPEFFPMLLETLIKQSYQDAVEYAQSLLCNPLPTDQDVRQQSVNAAVVLLKYADDAGWDVIWPLIQVDCDFGKEVFLKAGDRFHHEGAELFDKLNESSIADLYIWMVQQFPFDEDPNHDGAHSVSQRDSMIYFRDNLLRFLENSGSSVSTSAIDKIYRVFPQYNWLRSVLVEAKKNLARSTWIPPTPNQFLELTRLSDSRLVQNADQLQNVIIESLRRLETKLQEETPAAIYLWDQTSRARGKEKFRPKDENHFSDYVKRHLGQDLRDRGVVVNREVQIRRGEGSGQGENTDIHITAIIAGRNEEFESVKVIIESKGCWHRDLETAMKDQLVDRYLKDNDCRCGIYLVGWYKCDQWDSEDARNKSTPDMDISKAKQFFDQKANRLSADNLRIKAFVINAALR